MSHIMGRRGAGPPQPNSSSSLLQGLAEEVVRTLDEVLDGASSVALLDFPNHANVGDSAIWLGELAYLHTRRLEPRYACEVTTYSAAALRRRIDQDTVLLLHGGGNFGDLWPGHHDFREIVIEDFPRHRIVQLPQTVWFNDGERAAASAARLRRHGALTVLVRDEPSLERVLAMGLDGRLCPDSAFVLGPMEPRGHPSYEIGWLLRCDHERPDVPVVHGTGPSNIVFDWLDEGPPSMALRERLRRRLRRRMEMVTRRYPHAPPALATALSRPHEQWARMRLDRGVRLLSQAEVLVTDRLHGHILALLLGVPHVVLDTRFGKVSSFVEAWGTAARGGVRAVSSPDDAAAAAALLLQELRENAPEAPKVASR